MAKDSSSPLRRLRRAQLLYVTVGTWSFLAPLLAVRLSGNSAWFGLSSLLGMLVPLACYRFTLAFQAVLESTTGQKVSAPLSHLALGTIVPLFGGVLEVVLYQRMATELRNLPEARDRSSLIVGLAVLRPVLAFLCPIAFGIVASVDVELSPVWLVVGWLALLSMSLLAVITQVLVAPVFDAALPTRPRLELGAVGGEGSVAVSLSARTDGKA